MKKKTDDLTLPQTEKKRSCAGELVSRLLTVLCVLAAILCVAVTVLGVMKSIKSNAPDTGSYAPEIITTEPATTLPSADTVKVKGTVYVTEQADIYAEASEQASVVASVRKGDGVGLVSADKKGWCKITYDGKVCYIQRKYLSTKKPEVSVSVTQATTADTTVEVQRRTTVNLEQKHWSVVVVDKNRQLPDGYEPELEYIAGSEHTLDSRVASFYNKMYDAAYVDGVVLTPFSGYRRYSTQESNYNSLVNQYVQQGYSQSEAENLAATEILPAGCSEHNLGFAVDIVSIDDSFKDTEEYKWLCENAYKYGFIERYPEGTQDITGVIAEPWHWRFIGPSYAKDMKEKGISTLEEYLQSYGKKY